MSLSVEKVQVTKIISENPKFEQKMFVDEKKHSETGKYLS